jgi:hypothetical protein
MTPESGAALMWFLRNQLFFDLGLDRRADVMLVVRGRRSTIGRRSGASAPSGLPYRPELSAHVDRRAVGTPGAGSAARVRELCTELERRLLGVSRPAVKAYGSSVTSRR